MSRISRCLPVVLLALAALPGVAADERPASEPIASDPTKVPAGGLRLPPLPESPTPPREALPPPVILSPEERIQECLQLDGVQRLDCLGNESLFQMSGEPCDQDPTGRCREIVGTFLMQRCQGLAGDEKKGLCLLAVATEFPDPDICPDSIDPVACYSLVAKETGDVSVLMDNLPSGEQRDMLLATHAAVAYDPAALDLIEDNNIHDMGYIYVMAPRAIGMDEYLPADYCNGLRGDYSDPNEDPGANRELCESLLPLLQAFHTSMATAETDAEEERVLNAFLRDVRNLQNLEEVSPELAAPEADLESPCEPGDCENFTNPLLELADQLRRRGPPR